jgi:uncharacterized protein YbjT (DUF2867 family)
MKDRKKIIAVVGATGAQGGGLVRAILEDRSGNFAVRAITRDASSPKAKALAERGAEVVAADIDDAKSIARAFAGAYGAYCVTFFWDHFSPEKELEQAGVLAAAAKQAGLQHVVWSTLEDTRHWVAPSDTRMPTLLGKYKVPHFDAKGEADHFFRELGVPTTFLLTSFYWDNLIHFGMGPTRGADGKLTFTLPMDDRPLPGIAAEDIGRCAYGIFQRGAELIGKTIAIAGEHLSGADMAGALTRELGEEVIHDAMAPEAYRKLGFPGADDLGNMFQFKRDFNEAFRRPRDPANARALNPALQTFGQWLSANKLRIPLPERRAA